jgi:cyclophilin family peptidyl-prolyl cis-trans isomerase
VANFVALSEGKHPQVSEQYKGKPFYNGIVFHRVINDFMIQGGDPTGTGSGNPGYSFGDEFDPELKHDQPGILSMANSGPSTNGSQFFITEVPTPHLDNRHSVFGKLVLGLDIHDSISNVATGSNDKPIEPVVIKELNIIRKGQEAKAYNAVKVWEEELSNMDKRAAEAAAKAKKLREEADAMSLKAAKEILPTITDYTSKAKTNASGLKVYVINQGDGEKLTTGSMAVVFYEGYFTDGLLFDSNRRECEERYGKFNPEKEQLGMYEAVEMKVAPDARLIAGFKEALAGMRVGEKSFFYVPSHLAYGASGRGLIPPNTDLTFIIEIIGKK